MKKTGFTLSEVLITLAVIGVVAAMTLPSLIQNYQKKAWTTQLQKSYSLLNQGFQKMLADDGVDKLSDTSVWSPMVNNNTYCGSNWKSNPVCSEVAENLNKYFKIIDIKRKEDLPLSGPKKYYRNLNGTSTVLSLEFLILSDGTYIGISINPQPNYHDCEAIKALGGNMCSHTGWVDIDVNGAKGPNQKGRDLFRFILSDDGKLYPYHGKDYAVYSDNMYQHWLNDAAYCGVPEGSIGTEGYPGYPASESMGDGCAARIMENGWKMDY